MTVEGLQAVLAPKVRGLYNLHELAADFPAANIVCFSSIASIWGSRSLGHYAAANHFLDSFTHYRRARGLPAVSINWGPLQGGGMGLAREEERLAQLGIRSLSPARFGAILGRLLGSDVRQVTVADVDWAVFTPLYAAQRRRPFLDLIASSSGSASQPVHTADRDRMLAANGEDRRQLAEAFLLRQTAAVLKTPESQLDTTQPLIALGIDSLMAMEIAKRVQTQLGVTMPISAFLQGSTLRQLAQAVDAGLDHATATAPVERNEQIVEGEL
jgi:epothilone polyketide synthase D